MHPVERINGILNNGIPEKKTQEDSHRNIDTSEGNEHVNKKGAVETKVTGLVEAYRRTTARDGGGRYEAKTTPRCTRRSTTPTVSTTC